MAGNDLTERLNELLSNPAALSQMMSVAATLIPALGGAAPSPPQSEAPYAAPSATQFAQPFAQPSAQTFAQSYTPQNPAAQNPTMQHPTMSNPTMATDFRPPEPITESRNPESRIPEPPIPDSVPAFRQEARLPSVKLPADHRCALLSALKPYLKHSRADKIDMMIRILQISQLTQSTFGNRHKT